MGITTLPVRRSSQAASSAEDSGKQITGQENQNGSVKENGESAKDEETPEPKDANQIYMDTEVVGDDEEEEEEEEEAAADQEMPYDLGQEEEATLDGETLKNGDDDEKKDGGEEEIEEGAGQSAKSKKPPEADLGDSERPSPGSSPFKKPPAGRQSVDDDSRSLDGRSQVGRHTLCIE